MNWSEKAILQIPIFFRVCALIAWLGGVITVGAILAPTAFHTLPNTQLAGSLVGGCLKKLNVIALFSAGLIVLAELPSLKARSGVAFIRLICTMIAASITIHLHFMLFPELDKAQRLAEKPLFDKFHKQYTTEAMGVVYALIPVVALAGVEGEKRVGRKRG